MNRSKEAVAQQLADAHYAIEPAIEFIIQLVSSAEREADPKEPIKLLEVNPNTTEDGIHPIFFGPHPASGIAFPSVIVEVTPAEYEHIQNGSLRLPNGWRLGHEYARPATAGQR